ncbi:hypothetical protein ACLB1Q_26990 [Escherichia coli]
MSKMMKPGMGSYDRFKELFNTLLRNRQVKSSMIPYFISAHPGTRDEDMVNLALWLKAWFPSRPGYRTSSIATG